jgi:hypothetical protein
MPERKRQGNGHEINVVIIFVKAPRRNSSIRRGNENIKNPREREKKSSR